MTTFRFESLEPSATGRSILSLTRIIRPCWIARLFGARPSETREQYIGSGTVWLTYPGFESVDEWGGPGTMLLYRFGRFGEHRNAELKNR